MKVVLESGQSDEKFLTDLRSAFPDVTFLPSANQEDEKLRIREYILHTVQP